MITKIGKLLLPGAIILFILALCITPFFKEGGILRDVSLALKDPFLSYSQAKLLEYAYAGTYCFMSFLAIIYFFFIMKESVSSPTNQFQNFILWLGIVLIAHGIALWIITHASAHLAVSAVGALFIFAGIYFRR